MPLESAWDVVVIGGGSAAGLKTAIIEGAPEVGGLRILRGCMPTKTLLQSAEVRHIAQRADRQNQRP